MAEKTLEERYGNEIMTDNTQIKYYPQCETCEFRIGETLFSNAYFKSSCAIYEYPESKPIGLIFGKELCEYYEKGEP